MRDRIVVAVCNFIIQTFASEYYKRMFTACVALGLKEMDRLVAETSKKE